MIFWKMWIVNVVKPERSGNFDWILINKNSQIWISYFWMIYAIFLLCSVFNDFTFFSFVLNMLRVTCSTHISPKVHMGEIYYFETWQAEECAILKLWLLLYFPHRPPYFTHLSLFFWHKMCSVFFSTLTFLDPLPGLCSSLIVNYCL